MGALRMAAHAAKSAQRGQVKKGGPVTVTPEMRARAEALAERLKVLREQLAAKSEPTDMPVTYVPPVVQSDRNPDRPQSLEEMIGQADVRLRLQTVLSAAMLRGERMSHVLISGPPGFGKTSLAELVAGELGVPMISTSGILLKRAQDVTGLVMRVEGPAVLWIDECHSMGASAAEAAYQILEDGKIDLLASSGPDTVATTHTLPDLVIVAATTRIGLLSQPFRDRFGLKLTMSDYSQDELGEIVARYWKSRGVKHFRDEHLQVAQRSRGVPRNCVTLANRVLDYAAVADSPNVITSGMVAKACDLFGINSLGLDANDMRVLSALTGEFCGRSIGLDALAAHCDIDAKTISETVEPFLSRSGWIIRTGRGRLATSAAYELMKG